MKNFRVTEKYYNSIFSEKKQINWDQYNGSDEGITLCGKSVYRWFKCDGWENAEFVLDTIEQAKSFIDEQTTQVEYVEINQEFAAFFYMIFQYNESTEEYDIDCTIDYCNLWEKEYKPKYSTRQLKDEIYYCLENLRIKDLISVNNIVFENDKRHYYVDRYLEYDEDKDEGEYDINIDELVEFIFFYDQINYNDDINAILAINKH